MPAARTAGSSFADVSEEVQSPGQAHPSPHPWDKKPLAQQDREVGVSLLGPQRKGQEGRASDSSEMALSPGWGQSPAYD